MVTCLCDAFYDDVGASAVAVLERAGCEVVFPESQTCCGQPAYTAGDWEACRRVVRHALEVFAGDLPVVSPSGSCAAALFHEAPLVFEGQPELPAVRALAQRCWELSDFLVNGLGLDRWPGRLAARIAVHPGCHNRGTPTVAATCRLLASIDGVELLDVEDADLCCGFGGVFSVAFPQVSTAMGRHKIQRLMAGAPDLVVSPDSSCLMHQSGLAAAAGRPFPARHVAQVLRDAAA
jgi:L-lactate dehydrogenase complex protein LldE